MDTPRLRADQAKQPSAEAITASDMAAVKWQLDKPSGPTKSLVPMV